MKYSPVNKNEIYNCTSSFARTNHLSQTISLIFTFQKKKILLTSSKFSLSSFKFQHLFAQILIEL